MPRGPGRPRSEAAHRAILDAAIAEVRAVGFDGMSIEGVAARAGVGKTTIYRRWPGKELLVADAVAGIARRLPAPATGSTAGDLMQVLGDNLKMYADPATTALLSALVAAMARSPAVAAAFRGGFMAVRREALREVLVRGRDRGELRADTDVEVALDMLAGPLFYRSLLTGDRVDLAFLREVVEAVLRAFAPRDAAHASPR